MDDDPNISRLVQLYLEKEGFEAVFIGSGAGLPMFMGIPGEQANGVFSANEYLTRNNLMKAFREDYDTPIAHGKKVAVVGGGNVAMDAARTALRLGAEVHIVYRRSEEELPARVEEVHHAKEEGVIFDLLTNPKEILADAGYQDTDGDGILDKDGVNLSFKVLTYSYNDNCIQLADMLQAELSQIGIELSIETQDVLDDPLASGDFDLAILNYAMAPIGTPSYFINMLFTTGASNNYGGYSNEKVDALAAEIGTTSDNDKVVSLTRELEQQVLDDMPFAFVADQQLIFVYSNKVKGVQINPTEYYLVTNTLSVEE